MSEFKLALLLILKTNVKSMHLFRRLNLNPSKKHQNTPTRLQPCQKSQPSLTKSSMDSCLSSFRFPNCRNSLGFRKKRSMTQEYSSEGKQDWWTKDSYILQVEITMRPLHMFLVLNPFVYFSHIQLTRPSSFTKWMSTIASLMMNSMDEGRLYQKGQCTPWLKCILKKESELIIAEIHAWIC